MHPCWENVSFAALRQHQLIVICLFDETSNFGSAQTTQISPPAPWASLGRTIGKRPASANHRPHPSRLGTSNLAPFPKPSAPAFVLMKTKVQPVYVFVPPGVQQRLWERLAKPRPLLLRYGTAATLPPKRNWATSIKKWNGCWPPISSRPLTISAITVRQGRGPRAGRWRLPAWSALRQFSLLLPEQNSEQTAVLDSTDAPIAKRNPPVPRPHRPKYARCRNRFAGAAFSQRCHKLRVA